MRSRIPARKALALCLALAAVYGAGVASAANGQRFATSINLGLVKALDSVGRNLFGTEGMGVTPCMEDGEPVAVQVDFVCAPAPENGAAPAFPRIVNIVYPPDPFQPGSTCRIGVQLLLNGDGTMDAIVDPEVSDFKPVFGAPVGEAICAVNDDGGGR